MFSKTPFYISLLCIVFFGSVRKSPAAVPFLTDIRNGEIVRIGTLGTSLTAVDTAGGSWVSSMAAWLESESPNPTQVRVHNFGKGSSSSWNAEHSLSGMETQLPQALNSHLDVAFIEFAMNDAYLPYGISQADSVANLNYMIDSLQASNPQMTVILQTMNDTDSDARPELEAYYQGYRDVAMERGLMLIDHDADWSALHENSPEVWDDWLPDGVHPIAAGREAVILPNIQEAFLQSVPEPSSAFLIALAGLIFSRRSRS